ncbi:unnamed protein product [Lampetra fluviatilis]
MEARRLQTLTSLAACERAPVDVHGSFGKKIQQQHHHQQHHDRLCLSRCSCVPHRGQPSAATRGQRGGESDGPR